MLEDGDSFSGRQINLFPSLRGCDISSITIMSFFRENERSIGGGARFGFELDSAAAPA